MGQTAFGKCWFCWVPNFREDEKENQRLQQEFYNNIKQTDKAANITPVFEENWNKAHEGVPRPSMSLSGLSSAIWTTYRSSIVMAVLTQLFVAAAEVGNSCFIYHSIRTMQRVDHQAGLHHNKHLFGQIALWMGTFMVIHICIELIDNFSQHRITVTGLKVRTCLDHMIMKKVLRKNFDRDRTYDLSKVANLTQVDSFNIGDLFRMLPLIVSIPMKITFGLAGLFLLMGWAMVPTMGVFCLILLGNYFMARLHEYNTANYLRASEKRIKFVSELFSNLKFIKMCGLENQFMHRLMLLREQELHWVFRTFLRWAMLNFIQMFGTGLFLLSMYIVRLYYGGSLAPGEAITASILFSVFNNSIRFIAQIGVYIKECIVSGKRICLFLLSEEVTPQPNNKSYGARGENNLPSNPPAVTISQGWFFWQDKAALSKLENLKSQVRGGPQTSPLPPKAIELKQMSIAPKRQSIDCTPLLAEQPEVEGVAPSDYILKALELAIKPGECVAIIGRTGAGKSSLLAAILGEIYAAPDSMVSVNGSMAYVSQKPWITSSTIKDVILFGKEYHAERFEACLKYSGLEDDLKNIQGGIDTVLGDKGVNLSGGQRTRISIARALYSQADIYLFDDPISALDVEVGRHIIEKCLLEYLDNKTRLVVIHSLAYLGYFDRIILMDEGRVVASGTYLQMIETREYKLFCVLKEEEKSIEEDLDKDIESEEESSELEIEDNEPPALLVLGRSASRLSRQSSKMSRKSHSTKRKESTRSRKSVAKGMEAADTLKIFKDEQNTTGSVITWALLQKFYQEGGGLLFVGLVVFALSTKLVLDLYNVWYVQEWTSRTELTIGQGMISTFGWNLALLALAITGMAMLQNYGLCRMNLHRSVKVSFMMAFGVMHASIVGFIDNIPTGRVLNIFIKDLSVLDTDLLNAAAFFTFSFFAALTDCVAAVYGSSIWVIFFFGVYLAIVLPFRKDSLVLNRESTRMRSVTASPLIQAISEAASGFATIRVFGTGQMLLSEFHRRQDEFFKNCMVMDAVTRWFVARLTFASVIILVPSILLNIFVAQTGPGVFGFLMRFLIVVIQDINDFLNCYALFESRLVSLERCLGFTRIPPEVGYQDLEKTEASLRDGVLPPIKKTLKPNGQVWPSSGDISIKGLKVKYRPGLPEVLKGLTLTIKHGTKVGIVGRTGAGKSTLLSCLYRHFEEYSGEVVIDGRELRDIDLKELRSNITIIPQDPYIFQDSVKVNLDPMGHRTDTELENILKEINLWEKFRSKGGLDAQIEKGGSDLSQGEKQLLCLARALLHRNKVVLIDEATANIDANSEVIIQKLLEEKFKDCTMLMIAHRLNTVMKCDNILVLDQGSILEYGSLEDLKKDTKSHFYNMMNTLSDLQQALS